MYDVVIGGIGIAWPYSVKAVLQDVVSGTVGVWYNDGAV